MTRMKARRLHPRDSRSSLRNEIKEKNLRPLAKKIMKKPKTRKRALKIRSQRTKRHLKTTQVKIKKAKTLRRQLGKISKTCSLAGQVDLVINTDGSWQV